MPRGFRVSLQDVLQAIGDVAEFVAAMTQEQFKNDKKTIHAVVRNLEVIGEAIKCLPPELRNRHPGVPWQRIAGLRAILIHHYFGIDVDIVWDIVQTKLPELKIQIEAIVREFDADETP
jgi:uncharacterized protein with HEPN domain